MPDIQDNENVWSKINFLGATFIIGAVYRPSNSPVYFLKAIQDYLTDNSQANSHVIIAGDFNLPEINWDRLETGKTEVKSSEVLLDIAFGNGLVQIVSESTRCGSLLDLIFVNSQESEYSISVEEGLSDNKLVFLCMKHTLPQHNIRKPPICV